MEKFTREYAEKLAQNDPSFRYSYEEDCFAYGYMKAIEETNAPELLEALKTAHNLLPNSDFKRDLAELIDKATL
jgi:hypothetical protein